MRIGTFDQERSLDIQLRLRKAGRVVALRLLLEPLCQEAREKRTHRSPALQGILVCLCLELAAPTITRSMKTHSCFGNQPSVRAQHWTNLSSSREHVLALLRFREASGQSSCCLLLGPSMHPFEFGAHSCRFLFLQHQPPRPQNKKQQKAMLQ